jgi:hypothetical protein
MGTNELGWSAARFSAVRFLALALSVSTAALALCAHTAHAADPKKSRDKIVELNKQALLSYEAKDFDTAKELLTKALKEAKQSGLEDDKMTARTYLHMGAVNWVGFQDQALAVQNFALAKKIRPDIQLTPSIETADLKSVFDLAVAEPEPAPAKPVTPVRPQAQSRPTAAPTPQLTGDDGGEPDLPSSMRAPLMCAVPDVVPPGKDMSIRCALKPGLNAKVVQLHHRAPGVEAYQVLAMRKTAKGWFIAMLPGHVMKPGNLQVYFDARDASDNEIASNGHVDSPSVIEVRKKGAVKLATSGDCSADDPMCNINRGAIVDAYEAGLHRRREGAIWIGFGGGAGVGYVPGGNLEWRQDVKVSAVTAPTGQYHILPEIGYMTSDTFGLAVQGRIEFIPQEQLAGASSPTYKGAPTDKALAVMLRGINYTDLAGGNLQFTISGDIGGGYLRVPVKPVRGELIDDPNDKSAPKIINPKTTIYRTDTRPIGVVIIGASSGFIYHFNRHFAVALEVRALSGLPKFGAVLEGQLSLQLGAFGKAGPVVVEGEGEGEGGEGGGPGPGPVNEAPPPPTESEEE